MWQSHLFIQFDLILKKISAHQFDKVKIVRSFVQHVGVRAIFLSHGLLSSAQLSPCLFKEQPWEQAAGGKTWPYSGSHSLVIIISSLSSWEEGGWVCDTVVFPKRHFNEKILPLQVLLFFVPNWECKVQKDVIFLISCTRSESQHIMEAQTSRFGR